MDKPRTWTMYVVENSVVRGGSTEKVVWRNKATANRPTQALAQRLDDLKAQVLDKIDDPTIKRVSVYVGDQSNPSMKAGRLDPIPVDVASGQITGAYATKMSKVDRPRVFYRGTNPGDRRRIKTGYSNWDSYVFVSSNRAYALDYGKHITIFRAKASAKILYEGTREFISMGKGVRPQDGYIEWCNTIASRAKAAGYDAVWFQRQGDVGTTIFNPQAFDIEEEQDS